jgi:DNA-binding CsgD family transcriptional regulator
MDSCLNKGFEEERKVLDHTPALNMIKNESHARGLNFLIHYGIRYCFKNGYTSGLTTSENWNKFVNSSEMNIRVKDHYSHYLKYLSQRGLRYQIRRKEDANTDFLKKLEEFGLCNSLTIFTKSCLGVVAYFFVASPDNKDAGCMFYNKLALFEGVVTAVENTLKAKGNEDNLEDYTSGVRILSDLDRRLVFEEKAKVSDIKNIYFNGREIVFTTNEISMLKKIRGGYTLKSLSKATGLTGSGVDFHLHNIRKKINANNKQDLIEFANQIQGVT